MAPRLSRQPSIFGVVFFVSKSLLGIERLRKLHLTNTSVSKNVFVVGGKTKLSELILS